MKLDKLKQAKEIEKGMSEKKDLLENVKKLLPQKEKVVEVRVRGTVFELSKSLFTAQLNKLIKKMEEEIKDLGKQLTNL